MLEDVAELESVDMVDFGVVPLGATARRAFVVRTRDARPLSLAEVMPFDAEQLTLSVPETGTTNFAVLTAIVKATTPGICQGLIRLVFGKSGYRTRTVKYYAKIVEE